MKRAALFCIAGIAAFVLAFGAVSYAWHIYHLHGRHTVVVKTAGGNGVKSRSSGALNDPGSSTRSSTSGTHNHAKAPPGSGGGGTGSGNPKPPPKTDTPPIVSVPVVPVCVPGVLNC